MTPACMLYHMSNTGVPSFEAANWAENEDKQVCLTHNSKYMQNLYVHCNVDISTYFELIPLWSKSDSKIYSNCFKNIFQCLEYHSNNLNVSK